MEAEEWRFVVGASV
jgi:uncharacterized membrane protein